MRFILAAFLLHVCTIHVLAQEFNNWFFGHKACITFNVSPPDSMHDVSVMTQYEGVASISDENGNLLFYTNGMEVYNKNHQTMQYGSGLNGHITSTNSAFIVPWPGHPGFYYLFTISPQATPHGLQYSIVDMNKNNGLGAVDSTRKNVPFLSPVCEKIAAVQSATDSSIWVVTHPYNSDQYHAYSLGVDGLDTVPIVSPAGEWIGNISASTGNAIGGMKISLDGTKIAAVHRHYSAVEIMDFNPATGQFSNLQTIDTTFFTEFGPYGVEF